MLQDLNDSKTQSNTESIILTEGDPEVNATNSKTMFAKINGKEIAYHSIGEGSPMILCPRFRGNLDDWDPALSR